MKKEKNPVFYIIITIFLVFGFTLSVSFLLAEGWSQPTQDTPNGGFIRPVTNEGDDTVYYTPKSLEVEGNFVVGSNDLYVNSNTNLVGINTSDPKTELDVNGPVKLGNLSTAPACVTSIFGSMYYSTTQKMPYICTSSGWKKLQADYDGDGQY